MQQHSYTPKTSKIISQSFLIWFSVLAQFVMNILMIVPMLKSQQYTSILFINLGAFCFTLPNLYIFFNYYKYSAKKTLIISYHSIKLVDQKTQVTIELINAEIEFIELSVTKGYNFEAWKSYEYFCLIDKEGKRILVNSFIIDLSDFWQDTLTSRVSSHKIVRIERYFPTI